MYLGIDIGTQSVKALMYDAEQSRVAGVHSAPLEMLSDTTGKREQLAQWWLDALGEALQQFSAADRTQVQAIAVSGEHRCKRLPCRANSMALFLWASMARYLRQ